jgi:glucokinase
VSETAAREVALAVDIGGTKLSAGRVTDDGDILASETVPTEGADAEDLWLCLSELVDRVRQGDEVICGVGCGGPMHPGGTLVSPLNIPVWRDFPLLDRLGEHLALAVTIDNDAKALALAEGWRGAARGVDDFIGMVVSTGVGGGIVLDGRLLDGRSANAGHIGHVIVEPDGRVCRCGARGCLEAEASGTAIREVTGRPPVEAPLDVRQRTGRLVGRAVGSTANLLDLGLAVVAGGVALGFGDVFFEAAQAELDLLARLDFSRGARIVRAELGAEGPLVGAAALAWRSRARLDNSGWPIR